MKKVEYILIDRTWWYPDSTTEIHVKLLQIILISVKLYVSFGYLVILSFVYFTIDLGAG